MDPQAQISKFGRFSKYYRQLEPVLERPKTRMYTAIIFSFLAVSLFGWYAIRPTITTILYLRREIADKSEINRQMENKIVNLIEAQAAYQDIQSQLPLIEEAIPKTSDAVDLSIQLRNIVQSTEATYSSLRVSEAPITNDPADTAKTAKKTDGNEFTINITTEGNYLDLEKIITEINTMRRLVSYNNINFSVGTDGTEAPVSSESASATYLHMTSNMQSFYNP